MRFPKGFEECDYEYDYLDIDAVAATVYCGDPPPEEPEENEQEEVEESEDNSEPEDDQTEETTEGT